MKIPALLRLQPLAIVLLRIGVGLIHWTHGPNKLFGWFGGQGGAQGLFLAAGVIETVFCLFIVAGFLVQPVALLLSLEMLTAYTWVHTMGMGAQGAAVNPLWWSNHGEIVAVFMLVWFFFATTGAGRFSVDDWLARRKAA